MIVFRIVGEAKVTKIPCRVEAIKRFLKQIRFDITSENLEKSTFHLLMAIGDKSSYNPINNHFIWRGNSNFKPIEGWFE